MTRTAATAEPSPTADLGQRAVRGLVTLGMREGALKMVAIVGFIALYRLLTPDDFGIILPIAFLAGLVKLFADVGLQPSLIQRGAEPTGDDLRAVFTAQLALAAAAVLVVFFAGPAMVNGLLDAEADPWMIRAFALSIFFSAFRLVPAALLERHLQFGRLATADILSTLWFYCAGIGFAIAAYGVWSLVIAHVGASVVSTLAVVMLRPWRPRPTSRLAAIRPYVNFGAQFQGSRLALILKDSLIPMFSPRAFGVTTTGHLHWANRHAAYPLGLTQLVARVSLPAFARIQDEPDRVRRGAELSLKWNAIVTLPVFAAIFAFAPEIASHIYSDEWVPAVPALYLLAVSALLVPVNGLITPILNALGKTRLVLTVAVIWAVAAWLLTYLLTLAGLELLAIPVALAATQILAALALLPLAYHNFGLRLLPHLGKPLLAALAAGAFGRFVLLPLLTDALLLIQGGLVVAVVYGALLYLADRRAIRAELGTLVRRFALPT